MWFGVLGHLAVRRADGTDVPIPGPARRQVLAAMLCRPGAIVRTAALVEDLWGSAPPRSAVNSLRSHIVRLRAALVQGGGEQLLVTVGDGYRLDIAAQDVDAGQLEALVELAGRTSDASGAIECYDQALALWRDEPYVEFGDAPFAVLERIRLTELRALARERRTDLALAAGTAGELVGDLEQRVRAEPYRERGWGQLALALYRSGRQADALGACRRARRVLLDDLGVDPGPELQMLEQRLLQQDPELVVSGLPPVVVEPVVDRCPYLGLAAYEEQDAALFVGRERVTSMLAGRLADQSVVVVTGASGVGKSSLARAGLLPALRSGALPGSSAWRIEVQTPAGSPLARPDRLPDLLVLDQAEELFTGLEPVARDGLLARLARYVADDGGRLVVVLRSDFYGRLAEVESLRPFAEQAAVLVGPMRADELRRALIEPAARAGLRLEDELVEMIMDDVAGQPEPLPLLSEAMVRTWQRRDGELLTLDGYERSGELAGALEAAAEECYASLDQTQQRAGRHLLVRMAARTSTGWVRRPIATSVSLDEDEQQALTALIAARLLVADHERIEISHEALLQHWPRLRGWLDERRLAADLLEHLNQSATAWRTTGRQDSDLYRGPRLSAAAGWRADHPEDLTPAETEFLDASTRAADAELHAAHAQTRRLRTIAIALAAVVVLAVAGGIVALYERGQANDQSRRAQHAALLADARRLAALSADASDTATASQLALAAYRLEATPNTRAALLAAVERTTGALWRIRYPERVFDVIASANGSRVALRNGRRVVIVDPLTRAQVASFQTRGTEVVGFTNNGNDIVSYQTKEFGDKDAGSLYVQAVPSGRLVRRLSVVGDPKTYQADPDVSEPFALAVSSFGGRWIALATTTKHGKGVVIEVFDSRDWSAGPRRFVTMRPPVAMEASATALAVEHADGSVEVRALSSLKQLGELPAAPRPATVTVPSYVVAVSPDGSQVARSIPNDGTKITIYDLQHPRSAGVPVDNASANGAGVMHFSPDGTELAIGSVNGALTVYRARDGSVSNAFPGNNGELFRLAWAGRTTPTALYSVGLDGELISWDIDTQPRLVQESGPAYPNLTGAVLANVALKGARSAAALSFTPTGQTTSVVLNVDRGVVAHFPVRLPANATCCMTTSVSSNGSADLIGVPLAGAHGSQAGPSRNQLWDTRAHKLLWNQLVPSPGIYENFLGIVTPDGRRAYADLTQKRIGVYALPGGKLLRSIPVQLPGSDTSIATAPWAVDPAGHLLVYRELNAADNKLGLVDPTSGRVLAQAQLGDILTVMSQAWSNDGRLLAVGTYTGTLFILDAKTLAVRAKINGAETGSIRSISFSPDDQTVVTTGSSGQVNFWSVPGLLPEAHVTIGDGDTYAWYNADGRLVGFAPDLSHPNVVQDRKFSFAADPASLVAEACVLGAGNLSESQWQHEVGDQHYRKICP